MSLTPFVHLDRELRGLERGDEVRLSVAEAHHLSTVLRLKPGAEIEVADGQGSRASAVLHDGFVCLCDRAMTETEPRPALEVVQALPKGRKMDEVVRQTTELGVDRFVAVECRRSVVHLDAKKARATVERWRSIARAASEQSRRPRRPTIMDVSSLPGVMAAWFAESSPRSDQLLLIAHPGGEALPAVLGKALGGVAGAHPPRLVSVAIGPEGGWTDDELAEMTGAGGQLVGLGTNVLRTEHAAAASVAALAVLLGRWG